MPSWECLVGKERWKPMVAGGVWGWGGFRVVRLVVVVVVVVVGV